LFRRFLQRFFSKDLNIPQKLLDNIRELENFLRYSFTDKHLLLQALKHRSYVAGSGESRKESNERLEFLGDSVLNFIVGKHFYEQYSEKQEGELTKMRSVLVSGGNLSDTAREIGLGRFILIGEFEERSGGRDKDSILEDCMEALIGAVYLDGGIERTSKLIERIILVKAVEKFGSKKYSNYKSELLELVQSYGFSPPTYETVNTEGPEHEKTFTVNVLINGNIIAEGIANSKKKAEQEASAKALDLISNDENILKMIKVSEE